MIRKSSFFLILLFLGVASLLLMGLHAAIIRRMDAPDLIRNRELTAALRLTDLAIFTEARYMRHPSQADLHSAFQDHPTSLEHFPAGSFGRFRGGAR